MNAHVVECRQVSKSFQEHQVLNEINFNVKSGEFVTILGPSGCGKTTLLRIISGFEQDYQGVVHINGRDVRGLSPQDRPVNTVFQSYALFPHLSVFENVAFGLRCKKLAQAFIEFQVMEALRMVKLDNLAFRKPDQLSGGQQQRAAVARAIVNKPPVLLLDECLNALDYRLRKEMQIELKQWQMQLGISFIFVTHDQEEALSMSDRVIILLDGSIAQIGTPRQVYEEPKSLQVAKFVGEVNIFPTQLLAIGEKTLEVLIEGKRFHLKKRRSFQPEQSLYTLVRPEDIKVWGQDEIDDTEEMLFGVVEQVIYKGSTVDLILRLPTQTKVSATQFFNEDDEKLDFEVGESVWVHWIPGWEVILTDHEI
jgi:spermidine/putrescine transport system ATP-binding protein